MASDSIQTKAINTIKFLSVDGVQTANSGHPGLPMGNAGIAYTLWMRVLRFNPGECWDCLYPVDASAQI